MSYITRDERLNKARNKYTRTYMGDAADLPQARSAVRNVLVTYFPDVDHDIILNDMSTYGEQKLHEHECVEFVNNGERNKVLIRSHGRNLPTGIQYNEVEPDRKGRARFRVVINVFPKGCNRFEDSEVQLGTTRLVSLRTAKKVMSKIESQDMSNSEKASVWIEEDVGGSMIPFGDKFTRVSKMIRFW